MDTNNQLEIFKSCSKEVIKVLKILNNEERLMILCSLMTNGEMNVGELGETLGFTQPGLSQNLSILRVNNLVSQRREGKSIYYTLCDERILKIMQNLKDIFYNPFAYDSEESESKVV